MGLFKKRQLVGVEFRDVKHASKPHYPSGYHYAYLWKLKAAPTVGMWVVVPGSSGPSTAVITTLAPAGYSGNLKSVISIVSINELS